MASKHQFIITPREWAFVAVMVLFALIFTNKWWILLLDKLNPLGGFVVYYVIIYSCMALMSYLGLIVFGIKVKSWVQVLGSTLIVFAFFLVFNWTNPSVQYFSIGSFEGASNVYVNNSEDGIAWWFWSLIIHPTSPIRVLIVWILSFPITVFLTTLLGVFLVHKKPKLNT